MKGFIIAIVILFFIACGSSSNPSIESDTYIFDTNGGEYQAKIINLPACDENNPRVQIIKKQSDWLNLSNKSKTIFCVKPGDYQKQLVIIKNISGTKENPRYIILDNGNDKHPAKLPVNQVANVNLEFENSNYWIVDRMSSIGSKGLYDAPVLFKSSSNNIINRHFINGSSGGIILRNNSNNNTIQYSRIQNMSEEGLRGDRVCIVLAPMSSIGEIKNTHILYNEIHNCNDGFQAVARNSNSMNYEGTVVYKNDISVDSTLYSDCHGHKNINGDCSYSENAIDIKSGSNNPKNRMIIKSNRIWGYRKSETTNTKLSDLGAALVTHYGSKNIDISNNIIFDSAIGIVIADKLGATYALYNSNISNNFISNILDYPLIVNEALNIFVSKNTIINQTDNSWLILDKSNNISVSENVVIKGSSMINYGDSNNINEKNNIFYPNITDIKLDDKSFITNKFSNTPKKINPLK